MKKLLILLFIISATLPLFIFAAEKKYVPLVDIPGDGVAPGQVVELGAYLNGMYKLLISVTIILSVIVVTIAGLQHMTSESPFGKSEAKKRIGGAIGGMVLAATAWLILNTINPALVSFDFIKSPNTPAPGSTSANKPLEIVNNTIPANTGQPITSRITAIGGGGPYRYAITSGSLPSGTSMNSSTGAISGVPNQPGNYVFTVEVADATGQKTSKQVSIEVTKFEGFLTFIGSGDIYIPLGTTDVFETVRVTGGRGPYTFSITEGSLPGGLTLNRTTGTISGQPPEVGQYANVAELTVRDTTGLAKSIDITITVLANAPSQLKPTGRYCYTYPNEPGITKPRFCFNSNTECLSKKSTETKPTSSCFEERA